MDIVKLLDGKISVEELVDQVSSDSCGAVSVFVGTTRDNFQNKKVKQSSSWPVRYNSFQAICGNELTRDDDFQVVQLEYEAYEPMALEEMRKICKLVRDKWPVEHIAFVHR